MQARLMLWAAASGGAASRGMAAVYLAWTWRVLGVLYSKSPVYSKRRVAWRIMYRKL